MTLDELTTAHTPAHRAVGPAYVRAGCACGWTGCMCAYPAELRGEHRDHVLAVLYQWERELEPEAGT